MEDKEKPFEFTSEGIKTKKNDFMEFMRENELNINVVNRIKKILKEEGNDTVAGERIRALIEKEYGRK